jgi:hypothetical protein
MPTSNQTDLVKTTKWSLRCLEHKKTGLAFELKNLQTDSSHKLIFSCYGTNNITQPSFWTSGYYPIEFKSNFPVNFENFNNNLASIKPAEGHPEFHVMKIGWLVTIIIPQPSGEGNGSWDLYGNCRIEYGSVEAVSRQGSTVPGGISVAAGDVNSTFVSGAVWSGVFDR